MDLAITRCRLRKRKDYLLAETFARLEGLHADQARIEHTGGAVGDNRVVSAEGRG